MEVGGTAESLRRGNETGPWSGPILEEGIETTVGDSADVEQSREAFEVCFETVQVLSPYYS